jgi:hypothetical protein
LRLGGPITGYLGFYLGWQAIVCVVYVIAIKKIRILYLRISLTFITCARTQLGFSAADGFSSVVSSLLLSVKLPPAFLAGLDSPA